VVLSANYVVLLLKCDRFTFLFTLGAIINAMLGKLLKRLIDDRRPLSSKQSDPGMPSSHAVSLFFFAALLSAIEWYSASLPPPLALPCILLLWAYVIAVCWTRVYLTGDHTIVQVVVGAGMGSISALLWWNFVMDA
jgi:dolichyldiphosphatase